MTYDQALTEASPGRIETMTTMTLPRQDDQFGTVTLEIVVGDDQEGIGETQADPWNPGQAYEIWHGEAIHAGEGKTWDCPSGEQFVVVRNGDDLVWKEIE